MLLRGNTVFDHGVVALFHDFCFHHAVQKVPVQFAQRKLTILLMSPNVKFLFGENSGIVSLLEFLQQR